MKIRIQYCIWILFLVYALEGRGQITVDFSVSKNTGCGFVQSNFTDKSKSSAGTIVSWEWDIGGSKVKRQNPSRIFGNPGSYRVCLTVKDNLGNTGTKCVDDFVVVYNELTVDFFATDSTLCAGDRTFFKETAFSPNGKITQYIWQLGGSAGTVTSDGTIPTVSSLYADGGSYGISLTVKDEKGCTGSLSKSGFIKVLNPPDLAILVSNPEICGALPHFTTFQLENLESRTLYSWDFGNGQNFNGSQPPIIQYDENANFDLTITGVNEAGCRDTMIHKDVVKSSHLVTFSVDTTSGCLPLSVQFTDHSRIRADSIRWDFGDGEVAYEKNPQHTYLIAGIFQPTLSRLVRGCWITETLDKSIEAFGVPTADYQISRNLGCSLPFDLHFFNLSQGATTYLWEFGDGNTSTEFNPIYQYNSYGEFPVKLTAFTPDGCSHQVIADTVVLFEFKVSVTGAVSGCIPLDISAQDNSTSLTPVVDWLWEFSGDSIFEFARPNIDFTLLQPGRYNLTYTAANATGCVDSIRISDFAQAGSVPMVDFSFSDSLICIDQDIQFQDLSDNTVNRWFWEFTDGTTSNQQNPIKHFDEPGLYTTRLTGAYNGCSNSVDKPDTIEVLIPQALFTFVYDCSSSVVHFQNLSVGYDSLIWDFGHLDSTQKVEKDINPDFIYPGPGTYHVSLHVFNSKSDCQHILLDSVVIANPSIDLSISDVIGCTPFIAQARGTFQDIEKVKYLVDGTNEIQPVANGANIVFRKPGVYAPIYAAVTDMNGCLDTLLISDSLEINQLNAEINVNKDLACVNDTIMLTENSTSFYGQITAYSWRFNGEWSDELNRSWEISENQDQNISLFVENNWGCTDSAQVLIEVHQAIALFKTDSLACTSREIEFIHDAKGEGLIYHWEFGNGETESGNDTIFSHLYTLEGTYIPTLTVTDQYGCEDLYAGDTLIIANPVADFIIDTNYFFCPPYELTPVNTSKNASHYIWDFGDGTGSTELDTPFHVITNPGTYDFMLIAGHVDGCTDTLLRQGAVTIGGPQGDIEFTIEPTCAPLTVHISGQLEGTYSIIWDYGTGQVDTFASAVRNFQQSYEYPFGGSYLPVLILEDSLGCVRPLPQKRVNVNELTLDSDLSEIMFCGLNDNQVFAYNLTSSTHRINSWNWRLIHVDTTLSSTKIEPDFKPDRLGWYDLLVTAEHQFCRDTFFLERALGIGLNPQARGIISDTLGCDPFPVLFRDTSVIPDFIQYTTYWYSNQNLDTFGKFVNQIFPQGNHLIKQKVITEIGCSDSIYYTLDVLDNAILDLPDSLKTCFGETITLHAPLLNPSLKNVLYQWTHESPNPCETCDHSKILVDSEKNYSVTAYHPNGCSFQDATLVYFAGDSVPEVLFQYDSVICQNDFTQIISSSNTTGLVYQWDTMVPGLNCYDRCRNPIASPTGDISYFVQVSDPKGCTRSDTLTISVHGAQSIVGKDRTICLGDTLQMNVQGTDPFWHVANGLSCSYCNNPIAQPSSSINYIVSALDSSGCLIFDSIEVQVLANKDFSLGADTFTCSGGAIQLTATGPGDIFWNAEPATIRNGINTMTFQPTTSQYYHAQIDNDKCTLTDSVFVSVVHKAEIRAVGDTICVGDTADIQATGMISQVKWIYDGVIIPNHHDAKVIPPKTIDIMVVGNLFGCAEDTAYAEVQVLPIPNVGVPTQVVILDNIRNIELTNTNAFYTYAWSPPEGLSCNDCPNPVVLNDQSQLYYLTVTNAVTGCNFTDSVLVMVPQDCINDIVGVPNIFTPNGDGHNDLFRIYTSVPSITLFQVFNRWGDLLFETSNKENGWDGKVDDQLQPPGVYAYHLEYICPLTNEPVYLFGDVTLLR